MIAESTKLYTNGHGVSTISDSERRCHLVRSLSPASDGTTDEATSHSAKPQRAGQAAGYSHSTKLAKDASKVVGYPPVGESGEVSLRDIHVNGWLRAYRTVGRAALVLLLAGTPWTAGGQWLLDSKDQLPLGQSAKNWKPLAQDGVHDPMGLAIKQLQEPGEGLSLLPAKDMGNMVGWAKALDRGAISPRRAIPPSEAKVQVLDMDVLMDLRGSMDVVRFPHRIHTQWLACDNCHEHLFKSRIGANKLSMFQILQGEQCGLCHGSVAFPLTQCPYCHSVARTGKPYREDELD